MVRMVEGNKILKELSLTVYGEENIKEEYRGEEYGHDEYVLLVFDNEEGKSPLLFRDKLEGNKKICLGVFSTDNPLSEHRRGVAYIKANTRAYNLIARLKFEEYMRRKKAKEQDLDFDGLVKIINAEILTEEALAAEAQSVGDGE